MILAQTHRAPGGARTDQGTFASDERGAINLEFVLWLPLLLGWTVGFVALVDGFMTRNEIAKAHYMVADVVSREVELDPVSIGKYEALHTLLTPSASGGRRLRISQVEFRNPDYVVNWSCSFETAEMAPLDHGDIPLGLMTTVATSQQVLLVESGARHRPAFNVAGFTTRDMNFATVVAIRNDAAIDMLVAEGTTSVATGGGGQCAFPAPPPPGDGRLPVALGGSAPPPLPDEG